MKLNRAMIGLSVFLLVFFCSWQQIIADDPPTLVQSQDRKEILVDANDPRVSAYLQDHQIETRPYSEDRIWADVSDEEYQELLQSQVKSEVMAEYIYASGEPQSPGLLECYAQVYGSQSSDVSIPDVGGWVNSVINITHGPEGAVVDRFDCHVEIVHTYVGDLVVDVGNNQDTIWRRLWDRNGGSDDNINKTWYSISGLHGQPINQAWRLWVIDTAGSDIGYIDTWWIKIYYEVPCNATLTPSATAPSPYPYPGPTENNSDQLLLPILFKGGGQISPTPTGATPTRISTPSRTPTASRTPTTAPTPIPTVITIRPGEAYWIEAEDGTLTLPLGEEYGEDASGCGYIASYMYNYTEPPAVDAAGMVYVDIDVAQAGMYYIWARGNSPDVNHDSYWLQIDQGYAKRFQTQTERYGQWVWRVVNGEGSENQPHYLVQGQHRIKLGAREAYAKLDALVITSLSPSSYSPNDSMIAVCQGVSGECQSNATLSMSTWIGGNNVGMPQNIRYYQGCDWQESGPELVYSFWAAQNGEMLVELQNLTADLDLFVMSGDCNAFSCVAFGDSAVRFYANQGAQYFVAVDGYAGAVGTYQIRASYAATPAPTTATPTRTPTRTPAPITPTPEPVTTRILQADDYQNYIPGVLAALRNQNEIGAVRLDAGSQPCKLQAILLFTTAYAARDRNLGIAETLRFAVFDREKRLIWDTRDSPQGDPRISVPANPSGEPRNLDIIRYDLPNPIDLGPGEFYIAVRWPEGSNPENVGDGQGVHIWGEIIGDPHHRSFYGSWGASGTVPDAEAKPEINGQKRHVDLILRAVVTP